MKYLITTLALLVAMLSFLYYLISKSPAMNHANYSYSIEKVFPNTFLLVMIDKFDSDNPTVSLTNDMEYSLKKIFTEECDLSQPFKYGTFNPHNTFVVYKDSEGDWSKVTFNFSPGWKGVYNIQFHYINAKTQIDARKELIESISPTIR